VVERGDGAVLVTPPRVGLLVEAVGAFAWAIGFSACGVWAFANGVRHLASSSPTNLAWAVVLLLLGAGLVALGPLVAIRWLLPYLRAMTDNRPYFRADREGLECLRGRVSWSDVQGISIVREQVAGDNNSAGVPWLVLELDSPAALTPTRGVYSDGAERSRIEAGNLELTLWHCRRQARAAITRCSPFFLPKREHQRETTSRAFS